MAFPRLPAPRIVEPVPGHGPPCASAPTTCTGWNLDQLALDSAAGGGAGSGAYPTAAGTPQLQATQPGTAPTVAATSVHIDSHGADVTGATEPFELVLGQSVNNGFKAVATPARGAPPGPHSGALGRAQLFDGFANGGQVTAADLHALGGSSFTVEVTWTPQQKIWAALAVSAATLLLCLILGFLPVRARRWVRAHLPRRLRGPAGPEPPERPAVPFDAAVLAFPGAPAPKAQRRRGWLRFPRALVIGAACGGAALLVTPPLAGLVVAGAVVLGLLVPWARVLASVAGGAGIVGGSINVVQGQHVHQYLPGSNWDASFVNAGNLIWLGAALLLADGVVSALGLRVAKPLRRSKLRARKPGEWSPPEPTPVIIGIDG